MIKSNRHRARIGLASLTLLALVATACGSDDDSSADAVTTEAVADTVVETTPADTAAAATTPTDSEPADSEPAATEPAATVAEPVECTGDPVKLTQIASLTGPLAFSTTEQDLNDGLDAALESVNSTCAAGRPLEITLCDDKSDPNESTNCARAAKEDGSLALFGGIGTQQGATAAELPMVLTEGVGLIDLTDPNSYPGTSAVTLVLGSLSAAASAGIDHYLFVAADTPSAQLLVGQLADLGAQLGITVDPLLFPADITDFAPLAAQISGSDPQAIGMAVPAIVPFLNALDSEGINAENTPMFTAVGLMPPSTIEELGGLADGMYLITQSVPAQDDGNEGITQMLAEYEAAGVDTAVADIGNSSVTVWSKVHVIADALGQLDPEQLSALDSAGLVQALVGSSPIDRPELAPIDFSGPAFPDNPVLSTFRIFSQYAMAVQVVDGTYKVVSPFSDVNQPFELAG